MTPRKALANSLITHLPTPTYNYIYRIRSARQLPLFPLSSHPTLFPPYLACGFGLTAWRCLRLARRDTDSSRIRTRKESPAVELVGLVNSRVTPLHCPVLLCMPSCLRRAELVSARCRQPGWSANKGAGLITQESIERTAQRKNQDYIPVQPVQNLPERAGPAKNFTHPKEIQRKQLLNSRPKQPNKTAHNLVGCPNTTRDT